MRKPSLKRSISARTTGRLKREVKRSYNPLYGRKGMGWINNPSKAMYNKVYHQTTFSAKDVINNATTTHKNNTVNNPASEHKEGGGIKDIFKAIYYILVILWNLIKIVFFAAIIIGILYLVISIIF